jgi:hypothetical protein
MKRLCFAFGLLCAALLPARADTTLVFNEIMYHPATNETVLEWVELYNQMAVDLDIGGWRLDGDVEYTFPTNSRIAGRSYIIVAFFPPAMFASTSQTNIVGPFLHRLNNGSGHLVLRNQNGRQIDEVNYETSGEWPVAPDGSGVSLAKRDRDAGSKDPANWTSSEQISGTPGTDNFPTGSSVRLIAIDDAWKYEASGADLGTSWRDVNFNDSAWSARNGLTNRAITGLFNTGVDANGVSLADGANDPHYVLSYTAQGTPGMSAIVCLNHTAWLANDPASKWISVISSAATTINGGGYGYRTTFSLTDFLLNTVRINFSVAIDNAMTNVFLNAVAQNLNFTGFASFSSPFTLSSGFANGANTLEFGTENQGAGPGAFRALVSGSGLAANTNSPLPSGPVTYYFRRGFNFSGNPNFSTLQINPVVADGAVFYLNGVEVHRQNMPGGTIDYTTPASSNVTAVNYSGPIAIPATNLVFGANVLAVEVHQAAASPDGALIGAELTYVPLAAPPTTLAFNELSATTNATFWLELMNYGTNAIALDGMVLRHESSATNHEYVFPSGVTLNAGSFLALTNDTLGFLPNSADKLFLYPAFRGSVHDAIDLRKGAIARSPDGTGVWLVPSPSTPGAPNSFALHNEIVINEIMYHHKLLPRVSSNVPPQDNHEAWVELHNRSTGAVNLTGWRFSDGIDYKFASNKTIAAGAYLIVAKDAAAMRALYPSLDIVGDFDGKLSHASDHLVLSDAVGNPADEVHYYTDGRWPNYPDGGGSSLELRDPNADNSKGEAWAASDESGKSSWLVYSYRATAAASVTASPDAQWREFVFGLLSGGECLIDDISVVQNPGTNQIQYVANGNFENGLTGWRVIGNHVRSRVVTDPEDPANHALHVNATGPQEHMHNHIETTIANGAIVNNGQTYEISFRAKWLAGSSLLNTRLYFNRVARTTELLSPQNNGTPGARNSRYGTTIGPTFAQLQHAPVVPAASQPVTVSIVAQDPQGIASCQLLWSVNGGAFSTTNMTAGAGGSYSVTLPGYAAATLVQFYVRGTDGLGAVSWSPAAGSNSAALYKVSDGLANVPLAHHIRILMSPANTALLHADTNVMSNDTLPCTVIYDERTVHYDMGVRLKSSERGRNDAARVGFHLEFAPDNLFRGVHPVMLVDRSGGGGRPTSEEIVVRHMLLKAGGIPAVNADVIRVLAPQAAQNGVAIFAPRFEDEFVETAYGNGGDGTFFEQELIYYPTTVNGAGYKLPQPDAVQGLDITDVGTFKENYRYNYIIKNHRDTDDYSQWMALARPWSLTGATLDAQTRQLMDIDEWMRAYAMITLCGIGDMYTFGNNHNFMTYIRGDNHRAIYLPWDMDFSFTRANNAALVGDQNLSKIVNLPANLRCLYAHILGHIDTTYNTAYMNYWLAHYGTLAGQNYLGDAAYIQARGDFARTTITSAGGLAAFTVAATNVTVNGSNFVTFNGTAPVTMKTITIGGGEYPITWTSVNTWTLRVPVSTPTTNVQIIAYDLHDKALTNVTATATVNASVDSPVGKVLINEIMFYAAVPDGEYLELFNSSTNTTFDLSGWSVNGLSYNFPTGSVILPRTFLVLAKNRSVFSFTYGNAVPVFDEYDGDFQRDGETISLVTPNNVIVDRVRYEGALPWPARAASGTGSSYQLIDINQDNSRAGNWFSSFVPAVYTPEISTPAAPRDGWRFFSASGSIGSGDGNGTMRLLIYLDSPGSAIIDDLSIVAGTNAAVGFNYVSNGNFELPLDSAPTNGWKIGTNCYGDSLIISDLVHSGSGAFKIIGTNGAGAANAPSYNRAIYQWLSPAPAVSSTNTMSFWYWATNSATNLLIRIRNSAALTAGTLGTNINIFITPSNYIAPTLVSLATNALTPAAANQMTTNLAPFPPLWINEVQAENITGIQDSYGERGPWIELYNSSTNTVSLEGLYLTSTYTNLTNWAFPPASSIGPTQFLVVFCDGQPLQTSNTEYHTSFILPAASGAIALSRIHSNAPQVIDYVNYAGLHADRSYGSFPDGDSFSRQEFFYVTPGGTNDGRVPPITVFINEWMAGNGNSLADPADGHFEDWFELYNPSTNAVDIAGYYLTDSLTNNAGIVTNKFKYLVTTNGPHVIPPQGYLLVWADNETGQNLSLGVPRADLHVNFALSLGGEAIGLFAADGTQIDRVTFGQQTNDVSQGRIPDGGANIYYMPGTASPRAANHINQAPNTAPVLDAIGSKIIFLGQTLAFTATANDSDLPAQPLNFSLDATPPAGASITGVGAFSWTPSGVGTNTLTVRVTDNGVPPLNDFETITVEVLSAPSFARSLRNGDYVELTWRTRAGKKYAVDYKDDLNTVPWTPLWTNVALGDSLSFTNVATNAPQGFFRIRTVE